MAMPSTVSSDVASCSSGSLSGKGAFLQFTCEYVRVHVEHGLTGCFAGVEHETVLAAGTLVGDALRGGDHVGEEVGVPGGELRHVAVLLGLRDDEHVDGSLRRDVLERDDAVVLG